MRTIRGPLFPKEPAVETQHERVECGDVFPRNRVRFLWIRHYLRCRKVKLTFFFSSDCQIGLEARIVTGTELIVCSTPFTVLCLCSYFYDTCRFNRSRDDQVRYRVEIATPRVVLRGFLRPHILITPRDETNLRTRLCTCH